MKQYVPANLAIEAMRDNGYKNTAYAVCELIDNSIQADAKEIDLICAERIEQSASRQIRRLHMIAVVDNGKGMDKDVLWTALQFGNGTRLKKTDRTGIGRFGMGLPASSISQAQRVEVWSWQDGIENALYTYLDVNEVKASKRAEVPEPISKTVPENWQKQFAAQQSGTMVLWSNLDRLMWTKATTLVEHSEMLIGRIYRKFLDRGEIKIRMSSFDEAIPEKKDINREAMPNDPMYLMTATSCPAPFDKKAMFEPFGEQNEVTFTVPFQGEIHEIKVRLSVARKEARMTSNAGATPYGKHASKNVGISVVRADRELELDQTIVNSYEPRERWWGIEVDFKPSLDELMGVTNNKQTARNFSDIMQMDLEAIARNESKTVTQIRQELFEDGDPRAALLDVSNFIKRNIAQMRDLIKSQREGTKGAEKERYTEDVIAAKTATIATDRRKEEGHVGESDKEEAKPKEERKLLVEQALIECDVDSDVAKELSAQTIDNNLKYLFAEARIESDAFFVVRPKGGIINIFINTRHPAYEHLVEVLEADSNEDTVENLKERLSRAATGLKVLLTAWARYEDELPDGPLKEKAQDLRADWGRVAKWFMKNQG